MSSEPKAQKLHNATEKGIKIGKEEGRKKGKIKVVKAMQANNIDVDTIVSVNKSSSQNVLGNCLKLQRTYR